MGDDPRAEAIADIALGLSAKAIAAANRTLRPSPLDIVFERDLPGCVHGGPVYNVATGQKLPAEWLRVGITNRSGTVENVRVQALRLKPDTLGVLPIELHRMHDNPPPGSAYEQAVTVPASKTPIVFADVVAHIHGAPVFQLIHKVPGCLGLRSMTRAASKSTRSSRRKLSPCNRLKKLAITSSAIWGWPW